MLRHVALIFTLLLPVALVAGEAPAPVTPATKPVVVNPAPKPFLGVKVDENSPIFDPSQGLPVSAVIPGSTAATMGVQVNDLLRTFNGAKLGAEADLAAAIGKTKVGDDVDAPVEDRMRNRFGWYAYGELQPVRRWALGVRYDWTQYPLDPGREWAVEPYVTFIPSEFLKFRLGYKHTDRSHALLTDSRISPRILDEVLLQASFILGAHPAHPF